MKVYILVKKSWGRSFCDIWTTAHATREGAQKALEAAFKAEEERARSCGVLFNSYANDGEASIVTTDDDITEWEIHENEIND